MAKDKYTDLPHPGVKVRARVERLDGNPYAKRDGQWWDRECIAFLATASPRVSDIVDAEAMLVRAVMEMDVPVEHARSEVIMFHGTFVKLEVWCPAGTAARIGIKGYAPKEK